MKKSLYVVVALAVIAVGGVALFHDAILRQVIRSSLLTLTTRFDTKLLTDGDMHVWFCGTGSPQVERTRAQSCTAILAGGSFLVFDTGSGSALKADAGNLPLGALEAVFFTHLHSDHIMDLAAFANHSWRYGRRTTLHVFGPEGTSSVAAGVAQGLAPDAGFRRQNEIEPSAAPAAIADKGSLRAYADAAFPVGHDVSVAGTDRTLVYESTGGIKVYAFLVEHEPVKPAFGYRIEYKDRVVVISGDTRKTENVARHSKGADILIHEAYNRDLVNRVINLQSEVPDTTFARQVFRMAKLTQHYHTSPVEAAELAAEANVPTLVYTHIIPPLGTGIQYLVLRCMFTRGVSDVFKGDVVIAEDGASLTLPARKPQN